MILCRRISFVFIFLGCILQGMHAQIADTIINPADGIINSYAKVTGIQNLNKNDIDTVTLNDVSAFKLRDVVMIIQMKGLEADPDYPAQFLKYLRYSGIYEFLVVNEILAGNRIVFTTSLSNKNIFFDSGANRTYDPAFFTQLVKVPHYKKAYITAPLTCKPWDPATGTGGVLALMVDGALTLNSNIDVSGKGFLGADPAGEFYTGQCISINPSENDSLYYSEASYNKAARKGEGPVMYGSALARGKQSIGPVAGGGNGKFSGGAGGGNSGEGGAGGNEANLCSQVSDVGGTQTFGLSAMYGAYINGFRALMGSGGGGASQSFNNPGSKGGRGGGIVMILSGTLNNSSAQSIKANGESVTAQTTLPGAGGAGGGAGGSIVLDVNSFSGATNSITLEAKGGDGGSINAVQCAGAGGSGGGGLLFYSLASKPLAVKQSVINGVAGASSGGCTNGGDAGTPGISQFNLIAPLRGFLFNFILNPVQTKCAGETPDPILGSVPKGGDGPGTYTYKWISSSDTLTWSAAAGTNNAKDYAPPALFDTMYYKRLVTSAAYTDSSFIYAIIVHPIIQNNTIAPAQTICNAQTPAPITGSMPTGGNHTQYDYTWQKSTDTITWTTAFTSQNAVTDYGPGALTTTTWYRRKVASGACQNTTPKLGITVLPLITNNKLLTASDTICYNLAPPLMGNKDPGGGNGSYTYLWQRSADNNSWAAAPSTNTLKDYTSPALTDTFWFRRIVYSGPASVCKDTSNVLIIQVLHDIGNNTITAPPPATICEGEVPAPFSGNYPTGGDPAQYRYTWQKSIDNSTWSPAHTAINLETGYGPGPLADTTWFRRIVQSGKNNTCSSTSNTVRIDVHPAIGNNHIRNDSTLCFNQDPHVLFGYMPTGGNYSYGYTWQQSANKLAWVTALGAPATNKNFDPVALTSTTYYRRLVSSGVCYSTSDTVTITILPALAGNTTLLRDTTVCFNTAYKPLNSIPITGGNGPGSYHYKWEKSTDSILWEDQLTDLFAYPSNTVSQKTWFRRTVYSGPDSCCILTSKALVVKIHDLPTGHLEAIIPTIDTICQVEGIGLRLTLTGASPFNIVMNDNIETKTWRKTSLSLDTTVVPVFEDPQMPGQSYQYSMDGIVDGNQCAATDISGSVRVFVNQNPIFQQLADKNVCEEMHLEGIKLPGTASSIWSFINSADAGMIALAEPDNINSDIQDTRPDSVRSKIQVKLKLTATTGNVSYHGCRAMDSITLTFYKKPIAVILSNDSTLYNITESVLKAKPVTGPYEYGWTVESVTGTLVNMDSFTARATNLVIGDTAEFVWTVKDEKEACAPATDNIKLIASELTTYRGISPNGDDVNDYLIVDGLDHALVYEIRIYDQWGRLVFTKAQKRTDADPAFDTRVWNGENTLGKLVPEGTYYYMLLVDGSLSKWYVYVSR
jgi:hypothetical protein